jgi:hypothetical protein
LTRQPRLSGLAPARHPARSRGLDADDVPLTSAGLWLASDNLNHAKKCGGVSGHAGTCFFR